MAKAQKGDLIRVVALDDGDGNSKAFGENYKIGDILEVESVDSYADGDVTTTTNDCYLYDHEYEIHRKAGEEDDALALYQSEVVGSEADRIVEADAVNSPNHYTQGRFETIEIIEEITQGYDDGFVSYNIGNVLKYIARAPHKHDTPLEDLRKAERYLRYAIERVTQK